MKRRHSISRTLTFFRTERKESLREKRKRLLNTLVKKKQELAKLENQADTAVESFIFTGSAETYFKDDSANRRFLAVSAILASGYRE